MAEPLGGEWAPVTRLRLNLPVEGAGRSVVVKTTRDNADDWGDIEFLRRERIALDLLAGAAVAPALLGGDDGSELVVMADAEGPSLESVLLGADSTAATEAVVGLGDTLGRLHAATVGREPEHLDALARAGSPRPAAHRYGMWAGVDGWADIEQAANELRFPDAERARDDITRVRRHLVDPGPFLALTHTDVSPPNAIVTQRGVLLVDFEGSGFRHVGLDLAWLHFPFPNYSAHYAVLPDDVVRAADAAYRDRLAAAVPQAADDHEYDTMLVVGLAAALVVRTHRLHRLAGPGQKSFDSWRRRTQLVQQIGVFVDRCGRTGQLPHLAGWFADLAAAMAARWPDAGTPPAPLFPAYSAGG